MHAPPEYLDRFPALPPDRRIMAAMIAALDDGVGAIVEALRRTGRHDETLIFFSSANGPSTEARNWLDGTEDLYYGGSAGHFCGHKASLFEGGIREPALLSYPAGIPGGQVRDDVCATIDLVPTVLALVGADDGDGPTLDGENLLPLLTAGAAGTPRTIYWEYEGQLAVREGRWKLVLDGKLDFTRAAADPIHLADLEADPGERQNLADRHPALVARLIREAQAWLAEVAGSAAG